MLSFQSIIEVIQGLTITFKLRCDFYTLALQSFFLVTNSMHGYIGFFSPPAFYPGVYHFYSHAHKNLLVAYELALHLLSEFLQ